MFSFLFEEKRKKRCLPLVAAQRSTVASLFLFLLHCWLYLATRMLMIIFLFFSYSLLNCIQLNIFFFSNSFMVFCCCWCNSSWRFCHNIYFNENVWNGGRQEGAASTYWMWPKNPYFHLHFHFICLFYHESLQNIAKPSSSSTPPEYLHQQLYVVCFW